MKRSEKTITSTALLGIRCGICGRMTARVREIEVGMARITGKAHVDCNGHSQYRHVSKDELPNIPLCVHKEG